MRTIGIRAAPTEVTFAIFDTLANALVNVEKIKIPKALRWPDALKYVRNNVLDILREYSVEHGGLRITESSAQQLSIPRIELEGVIQEAFASSSLIGYYCGQISSISRRVGFPRTDFKRFVEGEKDFERVENWSELKHDAREAVLAAIGAGNA